VKSCPVTIFEKVGAYMGIGCIVKNEMKRGRGGKGGN
jgi:hypothetical protein